MELIVVLMILTGVSVGTGTHTIKQIRAGRIISNMKLIKAKVETISEQKDFENGGEVTTNGSRISGIENINFSEEERNLLSDIDIDSLQWEKWNKTTLEDNGLDPNIIQNEDYCYYVNYETGEVLYTAGVSFDNKTYYYTLTGIEHILANE